jgi:putative restriction endonuclease
LFFKLFDEELLVAEAAHGTRGFDDWLMRYHGERLYEPVRSEYSPQAVFVHWHVREGFRGSARYVA